MALLKAEGLCASPQPGRSTPMEQALNAERPCDFFCEGKCSRSVHCKLCLRSLGSEDPRPSKNVLAVSRTGNRGLVCDVCRNAMNFKHAADSPSERKERIADISKAKKDGQPHAHDGEVEEWLGENQKSAASGGRRVVPGPRTTCKTSGSSTMGLRRGHGYIWTPSQWSNFFKEAVDWSSVKTYSINDVTVEGILEPPTRGGFLGFMNCSKRTNPRLRQRPQLQTPRLATRSQTSARRVILWRGRDISARRRPRMRRGR